MSLITSDPRGWLQTGAVAEEENELTAGYSFELKPRELTVVATEKISPTLVRIRFSADDNFDDLHTMGPEDHLKLFFNQDDDGEPLLPQLKNQRWSVQDYVFRDYTIRWFDVQNRTVDIDFVLHDHGVAGKWAGSAHKGDRLGALGPRGSFCVKEVFPWYVMGADETSLPALARWLEGIRPHIPVTAYIVVDSPESRIELPTNAQLKVVWIDQPEKDFEALSKAIQNHPYPDYEGFVWVAGEALGIKGARRFLKERFDRDHWDVDGYWRRGTVNLDHHIDDED